MKPSASQALQAYVIGSALVGSAGIAWLARGWLG